MSELSKERLETLRRCPKCSEPGGCLEHRRVRNGHTDQDFYYYYWRHNPTEGPDGKKHRPSCYIGKVLAPLDGQSSRGMSLTKRRGSKT